MGFEGFTNSEFVQVLKHKELVDSWLMVLSELLHGSSYTYDMKG